jgi:osmotically-inducible protein OsmY
MRAAIMFVLLLACARAPVVPDGPDGDRALGSLVELRFSSDQRLCAYAIHAVVTHGVVRLEGLVDSAVDQKHAVEIATAAGARQVISNLTLSAGSGDRKRC